MISPVTVTTLPGTGVPATEARMVVADHGSAGFSPRLPVALSQPPSGVIWGCRTPPDLVAVFLPSAFFSSAAVSVMAMAAMARDAISDFLNIVLLFSRMLVAGRSILHAKGRAWERGKVRFCIVAAPSANPQGRGASSHDRCSQRRREKPACARS